MRVFYFVRVLSATDYSAVVDIVGRISDTVTARDLVRDYYQKVGHFPEGGVGHAAFLELLAYIEYLSRTYRLSEQEALSRITLVHQDNFFIHNEDIYHQASEDADFERIDLDEEVYFASVRDGWYHPFFLVLRSLASRQPHLHIFKGNDHEGWSYWDKGNFLAKIYPRRARLLGDVLLPCLLNPSARAVYSLLRSAERLLGTRIVLKKTFGEMGDGVRPVDTAALTEDRIDAIAEQFFPSSPYSFHASYIVPYVDIRREYRIYYRYDRATRDTTIYSVKRKINTISGSPFDKSSLKMYDKIGVSWEYIPLGDFLGSPRHRRYAQTVARLVRYDCGVLEVMEDPRGRLIFCEINPLGGSLMFAGEDERNLFDYYVDIYRMMQTHG